MTVMGQQINDTYIDQVSECIRVYVTEWKELYKLVYRINYFKSETHRRITRPLFNQLAI